MIAERGYYYPLIESVRDSRILTLLQEKLRRLFIARDGLSIEEDDGAIDMLPLADSEFREQLDKQGFNWLIENGFATQKDYFFKLRTVKAELRRVITAGWIKETTDEGICVKDNPHHFHTYAVSEEYQNNISVVVATRDFRDNSSGPKFVQLNGLTSIQLGHPCGTVYLSNDNAGEEIELFLSRVIIINIKYQE